MIEAICRLPLESQHLKQNATKLLHHVGRSAVELASLVPALEAHLRSSSQLVGAWLRYSESRWPAEGHWYLRVETGPAYHVFHNPPSSGRTYIYPDLPRACAEFIARDLAALLRVVIEHRARFIWSDAQVRYGLPSDTEATESSWFEDAPEDSQRWTLVCHFDGSPGEQGNPSIGRVHFLVDDAPHDRLVPGARLRLYERTTFTHGRVEILD